MTRYFDKELCTGCGNCVKYCPVSIIGVGNDLNQKGTTYAYLTNEDKCINCRRCEKVCPDAAVWFDSDENNTVLDVNKLAPHSGCNLGNLAYALGNAIRELGIGDRVAIYKKKTVEANTIFETHDYSDTSFFQDALEEKEAHPEKIIIVVCSSSKIGPYQLNMEELPKLKNEKITIIETLNWFNHSGDFNDVTVAGGDILENVVKSGHVSFAARGFCRTPEEIDELKRYIKTALTCQIENKNFAMVEMLFPCYYRTSGRPQRPMTYSELSKVRDWYDDYVLCGFHTGVLKEKEEN